MKKLISIFISILMVVALFVPMTMIPASAADAILSGGAHNIEIDNKLFGGACSTLPGPNPEDTTSIVFNGSATAGFGNTSKIDELENGLYEFSFDIMTSGDINTADDLAPSAKIGVNTGTTSATEITVNGFNYTNGWNKGVRIVCNVTNGYVYVGLVWFGASNANVYTDETTGVTKNTWIRLDNLKLKKLQMLDQSGVAGALTDTNVKTVTSSSFGANLGTKWGTGKLLTKRFVLEPLTTYTMYFYAYNRTTQGTVNGNLNVFTYNNEQLTFSEHNGENTSKPGVSIVNDANGWYLKEVEFTTGLSGVIWIKSWLSVDASVNDTWIRFDGLSVIKRSDNPTGYAEFSTFTQNDARFTVKNGGFVSGKEAEMTLAAGKANFFAPAIKNIDPGFYVISAYVKVSHDVNNFEWWGGNGSDVNAGRYTNKFNLKADEGWQYISSQFYVTGTAGHYGWWIPAVAQDTTFTFDGFKIEKLNEVSIDNTSFPWCKSTPTRFTRNSAIMSNSEIKHAGGGSTTGNITLEPNTEYIMYFNRKTTAIGDITISSGTASSSKLGYTASNGWVTEQVRFKTDSTGATKIFIWFGGSGVEHHFDGFAYRKVTEATVDKTLSVADFGVKGEQWLTNPVTGIVEDIITAALVRGDATGDGKVDVDDLIKLRKRLIGAGELTDKFADVNGDGSVDILDLINAKKRMAGLI